MAKKFYSKGKGANRKVIPISDKKGGSKSVNVVAIAYPIERMSEPEREFEASKEYVLDEVKSAVGLLTATEKLTQELSKAYPGLNDIYLPNKKKYPGIDEVWLHLKYAKTMGEYVTSMLKDLMKQHEGNVGATVNTIHKKIREIIEANQYSCTQMEKVIEEAKKANKDKPSPSYKGHVYPLDTVKTSIDDTNAEFRSADRLLMRSFRDMRRMQYMKLRNSANNPVIAGLHGRGSGQIKVVGDVSMLYNPDGSLKIKEFSRDMSYRFP